MAKTVYLVMAPGRVVQDDINPISSTIVYSGIVTDTGADPWVIPQNEIPLALVDVASTLRLKIVAQVKTDYPELLLAVFIWLNLV